MLYIQMEQVLPLNGKGSFLIFPHLTTSDIILFLNTVVNTATDLEERLEIRADLIYSGILPTVEKLKQLCFDELGKDFAVGQ